MEFLQSMPARETMRKTSKRLVHVDSRNIPDSDKKNVFDYVVDIPKLMNRDVFRNVSQIELKAVSFPKIEGENYVIMDIAEINDEIDSTSSAANRASCVLYFDSSDLTTGVSKVIYPIAGNGRIFTPNPPISSLGRLSVRFLKHEGPIVSDDFKETDGNSVSNGDHSFLLEITSEN